MKKNNYIKKKILVFSALIFFCQIFLIKFDCFDGSIDRDKPYDEIEHALSDKSIDDGIVINEKKDARDINETTFKANTKKERIDAKNKKGHIIHLVI